MKARPKQTADRWDREVGDKNSWAPEGVFLRIIGVINIQVMASTTSCLVVDKMEQTPKDSFRKQGLIEQDTVSGDATFL